MSKIHHPLLYSIFVILSFADLAFTYTILSLGGKEVNWIADQVHLYGGFLYMILYKISLVSLVLILNQHISGVDKKAGNALARTSVWITSVPVAFGLAQLLWFFRWLVW